MIVYSFRLAQVSRVLTMRFNFTISLVSLLITLLSKGIRNYKFLQEFADSAFFNYNQFKHVPVIL